MYLFCRRLKRSREVQDSSRLLSLRCCTASSIFCIGVIERSIPSSVSPESRASLNSFSSCLLSHPQQCVEVWSVPSHQASCSDHHIAARLCDLYPMLAGLIVDLVISFHRSLSTTLFAYSRWVEPAIDQIISVLGFTRLR